MGFSLDLGGNFGSMLAGFAERDMELRKEAREEAIGIAKDTLNFRAERAMKKKQERDQALKDSVNLGRTLMNNYGFTMDQVGVLAGNGQLEEVAELYKKASTDPNFKGNLPSAEAVVNIIDKKPESMTYEQYMRNIVIGEIDTTRAYERDIVQDVPSEDAMFRAFGFDPNKQARKFTKEYLEQIGMSEQELNAQAFDAFVTTKPRGGVDLTGFRPDQKAAREDILFKGAQSQVASTVGVVFGVDSSFGESGVFLGWRQRGARANAAQVVVNAAADEIVRLQEDENFSNRAAISQVNVKLNDPKYVRQLYNQAMGLDAETPLPDFAKVETDGGNDGGGFFSKEEQEAINSATDMNALVSIVTKALESKPGATEQGRRIRFITKSNLPFDKKKELINSNASIEDVTKLINQKETPANRYQPKQSVVDKDFSEEFKDETAYLTPEVIEGTRRKLEQMNVDINNKQEVKMALLALNKEPILVAKAQFEGPPKQFMTMLGEEYGRVADMIAIDAQGGLV